MSIKIADWAARQLAGDEILTLAEQLSQHVADAVQGEPGES